jgi:NADPH-dependent curcumin reductase CurA
MSLISNKSLIYKKVPEGMIRPGVDMIFEDRPLDLTAPPPKGLIVKTLMVGFDPHMRDRMKGPTFKSYIPGYIPDDPMNTLAIGRVIKSDNEKFKEGELITGVLPIAEYGVIPEWVSYDPYCADSSCHRPYISFLATSHMGSPKRDISMENIQLCHCR